MLHRNQVAGVRVDTDEFRNADEPEVTFSPTLALNGKLGGYAEMLLTQETTRRTSTLQRANGLTDGER